MGKLLRLSSQILNTPQLMEASAFNEVEAFFLRRNSEEEGIQLAIKGGRKRKPEDLAYNEDTGVGVLSIDGPLTYLEYEPVCGASPTSYQQLEKEMQALAAIGAKTVLMDVDSPGGEAYACFETSRTLRKIADDNGINLIAYVDGTAASAAYGLASAAHEIIMNPQAIAGSIGVVVSLVNTSKAEKAMGLERVYVYAGESKIPFDAEGNFGADFLDELQEKVDDLYMDFIDHVAEMRNINPQSVRETKAKTFTAKKALELGLADQVMTREEFFTYLSEVVETGKTKMGLRSSALSLTFGKESFDMNELEKAQAALEAVTAQLEAANTEIAQLSAVAAKVTEMETQLSQALEAVAALEADKAVMLEEAAAKAAAARLAKLEDAVGTEEAAELMAEIGDLPEASFDRIVASLAKAKEAVDASPMMTEVGADGEGYQEQNPALAGVQALIDQRKKSK